VVGLQVELEVMKNDVLLWHIHEAWPVSTQNDGCNEESQVTVVKLQGIELDSKLEIGLSDVNEGLSEAAQELKGMKPLPLATSSPSLLIMEARMVKMTSLHAILEKGHLVIEEEVAEVGDVLVNCVRSGTVSTMVHWQQ
jgi:hypothetical protein